VFGTIEAGEMQLSLLREVVRSGWLKLPEYFRLVELDEFVVMPNHVYGIIWLGGMGYKGEAFAPRNAIESRY
jgi:hypothetical protein